MTDASKSELERATAELADGKPLDWDRLESVLAARDLQALRILEEARLGSPDPRPLENGFEIRGELGKGSMGRVYRAFDRTLQREVALKIVTPDRATKSAARASFLAEARLLASVRHPAIVQVYSIHEHAGEIRMALELIEGRTLEEIVAQDGPLSPAEAARIGSELCRALAVLHERGITHRDLKPANVMREKGGRIVLLDFGIARSPGPSGAVSSGSAGTPRFMAPEQFAAGKLGPQADLWAIGALLYWLVSARFPFEGTSYDELARNVLAGEKIPLVDRRSDVDARFAAVVARALERDPRDRYRTAGELEQELRGLALPSGLAASGPTEAGAVVRAPAQGRRWTLGVALVVAGAGFLLWKRAEPAAFRLDAELYARRGGSDVRLKGGDAVEIGDRLVLEASSSEPFHLYVFNEDDEGDAHLLFPVPGFEPTNPLPANIVQRLPGRHEGEPQAWVVTSGGGGGETVVVVASREPLSTMLEFAAKLPPVQPGEVPPYPALPAETRTALLRGIGGTAAVVEPSATANPRATAVRDGLFGALLEGLEPAPGFAVKVLRLRNH